MIDDPTFRRESDLALARLKQALIAAEDTADEPVFEAEEKNGVLNVLFEDGSAKFVFTPNTPVGQIWISAISTSYKLKWDEDRRVFALPETGEDLLLLTQRLLRHQLNDDTVKLVG